MASGTKSERAQTDLRKLAQTSQGLFIKSVMRMMSFLKSLHLFYSDSLSSVARFQLFLLIWL